MRHVLSLVLAVEILTRLAVAGPDAPSVKTQIVGMSVGTNIELRLKNKQKMHGARGSVSNTGFMLVDARAGEHQIAFDDVVSVKPFTAKSHTVRNILIGVGIAVVGMGIVIAVELRCGPFGCK
jgi:hypothetical protein